MASPRKSSVVTVCKPNFLFIGADRCGSKWLHNILLKHPDVFVPEIADPYFFDREYDRGMDWYFRLFEGAGETAKAIGELSHDYIHSPEAAERIRQHLPDVKLIATLRHPVERAFSSYQSARYAGVLSSTFEEALEATTPPHLKRNSQYATNLKPFFDLVPAQNIKLMLYDQLDTDPEGFAREIFEFLEIPFIPGLPYEVVFNPLSKPRAGIGGTVSKNSANLLRSLGLVKVLGWAKRREFIRRIFYKKTAADEKPTVNPETRRRLIKEFEPEIQGVEKLIGRELPAWRL